jgi:hypothetical protein
VINASALPATGILIGNGGRYILFTDQYLLIDGTVVVHQRLNETPWWLANHLRDDPLAYDKFTALLVDASSADAAHEWGKPPLRTADRDFARNNRQLMERILAEIGETAESVVEDLQRQVERYVDALTNWFKEVPPDHRTDKPFVVPANALNMNRLFPNVIARSLQEQGSLVKSKAELLDAPFLVRLRRQRVSIRPEQESNSNRP